MNGENTSEAMIPAFYYRHNRREPINMTEIVGERAGRFLRKYGIALAAAIFLTLWTLTTCTIAAHNARVLAEERLEAEYAARIAAYEESRTQAENEATAGPAAQMEREADLIARVIGTMKTKRMKQTMLWNILVRVDSPYYPNSVEEVIEQPQQWMFYDPKNPIRDDDRDLALEQLAIWHDGRYPAGLSRDFIYGEWSESDYVLRDTWDKSSRTMYWRFPE